MPEEFSRPNFSQRNGLQPVPEQLKLEQISVEFRRLVHYALDQEIDGVSVAYSMGGMTLSVYQHDGENISNVAGTSEGTEISLAFAF